jgi:hypothetical protein
MLSQTFIALQWKLEDHCQKEYAHNGVFIKRCFCRWNQYTEMFGTGSFSMVLPWFFHLMLLVADLLTYLGCPTPKIPKLESPWQSHTELHSFNMALLSSFSMLAMLAAQTAALLPQPAPRTAMSIDMD